jgi:hypothetical protein
MLPGDASQLYRKYSRMNGVNVLQHPQYNIDDWLNPDSLAYKPEIAGAVFYYQARVEKDDRFRICIQTTEMKQAAWKYSHRGQLILDGTFGICDRRVLLFIALGVDEARKGVPLAFFLFSAPTRNKATHAGYDTSILVEVLNAWKNSLGSQNGVPFTPDVAITDTDTKERGALVCTVLIDSRLCIFIVILSLSITTVLLDVSKLDAHSVTDSGGPRPRALGLAHAIEAVPGVRLSDGGSGRRGRYEV